MAVYKIFPEKDATMYSLFPQMNTGLDEILDISNLNFAVNTNAQVARYLVKFDQDEINNVFNTYVSNSAWQSAPLSGLHRDLLHVGLVKLCF